MIENDWTSDNEFPWVDWQSEVANDDTRLGYAEWVVNQRLRDSEGANAHLIVIDGKPVSSCCHMPVERTCDYTDTHLFDVTEADVNEDGKVVSATYTFRKTYDGTDGANVAFTCQDCGQEIEQGDIEWDES